MELVFHAEDYLIIFEAVYCIGTMCVNSNKKLMCLNWILSFKLHVIHTLCLHLHNPSKVFKQQLLGFMLVSMGT